MKILQVWSSLLPSLALSVQPHCYTKNQSNTVFRIPARDANDLAIENTFDPPEQVLPIVRTVNLINMFGFEPVCRSTQPFLSRSRIEVGDL